MTGLAPWEVAATETAATSLSRRRAQLRSRFAAHTPRPRLLDRAVGRGRRRRSCSRCGPSCSTSEAPIQGLDVVFTLIGGSFAACGLDRLAPAARQPQRPADDRDGLRVLRVSRCSASSTAPSASTLRVLSVDWWIFFFVALILTLLTGGRLQSHVDRLLVASFAVPLVIVQVAWMLFDPEEGHLLLAFPDADVADVIDRTPARAARLRLRGDRRRVASRWWRTSRPRRRALLPSLAGALRAAAVRGAARQRPGLRHALADAAVARGRARWSPCRRRSSPACCARGSRAAASPSCSSGSARCAAATCRPRSRGRSATRGLVVAYWLPEYRVLRRRRRTARSRCPRRRRPGGRAGRARRAARRGAGLRRVARRRSRAGRGGHRRGGDRARERAPARRVAGAAGRAARPRASGSSRPATRSGGGWSATCTTARSSASSRSRCSCGCSRTASATTRRPRSSSTTASDELAQSLAELRELARGIHPAVLEHGLAAALDALATRSPVPTTVSCETHRAAARARRARGLLRRLRGARERRQVLAARRTRRVRVWRAGSIAGDRDRRRRDRRRRRLARLRPARARRPRRGARRAACASSARPAPAPPSPRSCRAGRDRRRQPARARGHRLAAAASAGSTSRPRRTTPRSCCARSTTHEPDVAIVDIRMPPTHTDEGLRRGAGDPRAPPADRRS